jgi:hypothetical protein
MPRHSQLIHKAQDDELSVTSCQLDAAKDPNAPISTVIAERRGTFEGRPYSVWRDDPELARRINDRLAGRARNIRIG